MKFTIIATIAFIATICVSANKNIFSVNVDEESITESTVTATDFDVHFYFYQNNPDQVVSAVQRRNLFQRAFPDIECYSPHFGPIGPHVIGMWECDVTEQHFSEVLPWLMFNHGDHSVLVHPHTGNEEADHFEYPIWIGDKLPLDASAL